MKPRNSTKNKFPSRFQSPEQSPGFLLWQVSNTWQRKQKEALSELDLTHVQFVLLAGIEWLQSQDELITQTRLAKHANTDPMMTSQVVRTLESKGFVNRLQDPTDQRKIQIQITKAGSALVKSAIKVVENTDSDFFGKIKDSEQELCLLLQNLIQTD